MSKNALFLNSAVSAVVFCLAGVAPGVAMAQTPQAQGAGNEASFGEIVVTAQKRAQSLQDVPVSVIVASGDLMRESQVSNLNDLGNRLSGVKVNNAGASDSLNIRGIGSGFNMGFEQSVATFLDGIYLSRSQITRGGFLDLERIEVLKGPQSTYFGSNAIAGALSAVTRKPDQMLEGYVSFLYAPSDGEYDFQAAVGGPLTGKLSGRAALRFSGMDGYIKNIRENTKGPHNSDYQGRVALRYETPGALDINWRLDYAKYDNEHSELQELLNCPPAPGYGPAGTGCLSALSPGDQDNKLDYVTGTGDSGFNMDSVMSGLDIAWTLGSHTLTSTTGYYWHDIKRFTSGGSLVAFPTLNMPTGLALYQAEKFHSFSQELRLESDKGGLIEYMLGLYYDKSNLKGGLSAGFYFAPFWLRAQPVGIIPANTPIAQYVYADQDQSNRSAFAAATVNLTDSFRINLGARYSSIRKEAHRFVQAGIGDEIGRVVQDFTPAQFLSWTTSPGAGRAAGDYPITKRTDDKFMPSVNVQYDVSSDIMVYTSFSTGFKAGGWAIGQDFDIFGPETVDAYEAGIKASWFDRRLTTNITVFTSTYKDLQESTTIINSSGLNQSLISNVGKARSRGIEMEIGLRPVPGLSIFANAAYLDAKYLEYPNAPCTQLQIINFVAPPGSPPGTTCTQDLGGSRKAYAPEWSGSVNGTYAFDVTPDLQAKLGAWVYFTAGYYQQASIDPLFYQPGYAKLDLRASIGGADERWELSVIAKNVTDKVTASYRAVHPASNAVSARTDRPRSIAIQISSKF